MSAARRREPQWHTGGDAGGHASGLAGWWTGARAVPSPNHGPRPTGLPVTLAVIHSISLPPGRYGGSAVERFFTNTLNHDAHPYFEGLRGVRVSAHFFIRRDGAVLQFVPCQGRAWHAGTSAWRGRENCNDYSLGIELEGLEGRTFSARQYRSLARLLRAAREPLPALCEVTGHEHVAPLRKADPGPGFDWRRLAGLLRGTGIGIVAKVVAD